MWRTVFAISAIIVFVLIYIASLFWHAALYLLILAIPLTALGLYDICQRKRNILRNYPIVGHFRYLLMGIRPQIQQYFIETEQNGTPYSKEVRQLIYQRAKGSVDTIPFGTQRDVYGDGFESVNHSLAPKVIAEDEGRIIFGNEQCTKPYSASRLNISAMSFGALSKNAIRALNRGAKLGEFAHNTGEGGLSPYHLAEGGDIIWQLGTAYFGCRTLEGRFDAAIFKEKSQIDAIKMIEIKLSQGAKPAHGGILPAAKVTEEIAQIRGLPPHQDAISPPAHTSFNNPIGLLEFVAQLRELSGGKPVGFKLCIGHRREFLGICKAMLMTKIYPDFITIDGAEGGTGAAPVEFTDFIGTPLDEGLVFARNCLVGCGLRDKMRLICSGKVATGFDMLTKIALGADTCNAARAMMFSLGCVQSRRCNNNDCPTGVATQDPKRMYALDIAQKAPQVANFHQETVKSFLDVLGATGCAHVSELTPSHIHRRIDHATVKHYDDIYHFLNTDDLINDNADLPEMYRKNWLSASAEKFELF